MYDLGFLVSSAGKDSACNSEDPSSIPGSGRYPGEGNGYPHLYSCLENSMDRGVWQATVQGVAKSQTWLNNWACMKLIDKKFSMSNKVNLMIKGWHYLQILNCVSMLQSYFLYYKIYPSGRKIFFFYPSMFFGGHQIYMRQINRRKQVELTIMGEGLTQ